MKKRNQHNEQPWGRLVAVLVSSAVTLTGVAGQLDPDTILLRAVVAGVISGTIVRTGIWMIRLQLGDTSLRGRGRIREEGGAR